MSMVYWDFDKWFKCPHCNKPIRMSMQESEGYGFGAWIMKPDFDFADEITTKKGIKEAERFYDKLREAGEKDGNP